MRTPKQRREDLYRRIRLNISQPTIGMRLSLLSRRIRWDKPIEELDAILRQMAGKGLIHISGEHWKDGPGSNLQPSTGLVSNRKVVVDRRKERRIAAAQELRQRILEVIVEAGNGISPRGIARTLKMDPVDISKSLRELHVAGLVTADGRGRTRQYYPAKFLTKTSAETRAAP